MTASATPAVVWLLGLLDAVGAGADPDNPNVRQCPAHPDAHPSLVVNEGRDGQALIHCRSGCAWTDVLAALTVPARYLAHPPPVDPAVYAKAFCRVTFPPMADAEPRRSPQARGFRIERIHDYGLHHRVIRYRNGTKKALLWETWRDGCWVPGLFGKPTSELPLYKQPDVVKGMALGEPVLLVESESSVDALGRWYATTWAGGAGSPKIAQLQRVLGGYPHLVVIPDHDDAGMACLVRLRSAGLACHILLPGADEDARDLYERVGPEKFAELISTALNAPRKEAA